MIRVTTLDGRSTHINAQMIERVEAVPETLITFTGGKKMMVKEAEDLVVRRILRYHQKIHGNNAQKLRRARSD